MCIMTIPGQAFSGGIAFLECCTGLLAIASASFRNRNWTAYYICLFFALISVTITGQLRRTDDLRFLRRDFAAIGVWLALLRWRGGRAPQCNNACLTPIAEANEALTPGIGVRHTLLHWRGSRPANATTQARHQFLPCLCTSDRLPHSGTDCDRITVYSIAAKRKALEL